MAKTKKKKARTRRPAFKFKRFFESRTWVWWSSALDHHEVGTVICQNVETGKVRVRNETNGGELWLLNHQPTPLEDDEAARYNEQLGRVVVVKTQATAA